MGMCQENVGPSLEPGSSVFVDDSFVHGLSPQPAFPGLVQQRLQGGGRNELSICRINGDGLCIGGQRCRLCRGTSAIACIQVRQSLAELISTKTNLSAAALPPVFRLGFKSGLQPTLARNNSPLRQVVFRRKNVLTQGAYELILIQ